MSIRVGIVSPLPPAPSGPADYVAGLLPSLADLTSVACFVPDPDLVDPALRAKYEVRSLAERGDADLVIYHIANNAWHFEVALAAREGPPGVVVLHDASLHDLFSGQLLGRGKIREYRELLTEAHGEAGTTIADLRASGERGAMELFLFGAFAPFVEGQLGVIVHSEYCRAIVSREVPWLPVHVVPMYALGHLPPVAKNDLGLPEDRFVVGHLGFITPAKRPDLLLASVARLVASGEQVHLVFAGEDQTWGPLDHDIDRLGLRDHVTVTGFVSEDELGGYASACDAIVSLRWPHVGESSMTLMRALHAGRPVVVQDFGSWAELPPDAVVHLSSQGDECDVLANALQRLIEDVTYRERMAAGAGRYARAVGGPERSAARQLAIAETAAQRERAPIDDARERDRIVEEFLQGGTERLRASVDIANGSLSGLDADRWYARSLTALRELPAAQPDGKLLAVGVSAEIAHLLSSVWSYDVRCCRHGDGAATTIHVSEVADIAAGDVTFDEFDLERDRFPYDTGSFDVVTCWDVLERLSVDPMHLLWEINRVLRPTGHLLLLTPNVCSAQGIKSLLEKRHPFSRAGFFRSGNGIRNSREYAPDEIRRMLAAAGLDDARVVTQDVWSDPDPALLALLKSSGSGLADRGDLIVAKARKVALPTERYPQELYH